jgi:hypothetical protein
MLGKAGWTAESQPEGVRRRVVLAGRVRDAVTHAPIAGAVVEISGRAERTVSRADGLFFFMGPVGHATNVVLRVHAPRLGTRYGTVEQSMPLMTTPPDKWEDWGDVALEPTRISGTVTDPQGTPIVGAQVRLCGDPQTVLTNEHGVYTLMPLVASTPTVEIAATRFVSMRTALATPLRAGEARIVNVTLTPARAS